MKRAAFVLCIIPLLAQAEIYKCTDANGKITYGDSPCDTASAQTITRTSKPSYRSAQEIAQERATWDRKGREIDARKAQEERAWQQQQQQAARARPAATPDPMSSAAVIENRRAAEQAAKDAKKRKRDEERRIGDIIRENCVAGPAGSIICN